MRDEGGGEVSGRERNINDILQDNHLEGKWNKGQRK